MKKLITPLLFVFSNISMGMDFSSYSELSTGSTSVPSILTDRYYSNFDGETYELVDNTLNLIYDLNDAVLVDINDEVAVGYTRENDYTLNAKYFLCDIKECNQQALRIYLDGYEYFKGDNSFSSLASQNMFSGHGQLFLATKSQELDDEYLLSIMNDEGETLDSFNEDLYSRNFFGQYTNTLTATTGVTEEKSFKLMSASYGTFTSTYGYHLKLMEWNPDLNKLIEVPVETVTGEDINEVYYKGLAPIGLSNPWLNDSGEKVYTAVFSGMKDKHGSDSILWGDFSISDGSAKFLSALKTTTFYYSFAFGGFSGSYPIFQNENTFTFNGSTLLLNETPADSLSLTSNVFLGSSLKSTIYKMSKSGYFAVKDSLGVVNIYIPSAFSCD